MDSQNNENGFISISLKLLTVILKILFVILNKTNSIYKLDKIQEEIIKTNKELSKKQLQNIISCLLKDINSENDYFKDTNKIDSKNKVIVLEILKNSINFCFSYISNNIDNNLFNTRLIELFTNIVKNDIIFGGGDTKYIFIDFENYLNSYLNYINQVKSIIPNSNDIEKNDEIFKVKNDLEILNKLLEDYKLKFMQKEKECEEAKEEVKIAQKQKKKIENDLNQEKIQKLEEKSKYETKINDIEKEMKDIKNIFNEKYNGIIQKNIDLENKYNGIIQKNIDLENKYIDLENKYKELMKQYNDMKRENEIIKKKLQKYEEIIQIEMNSINFLVNFEREFLQNLDIVLNNLNEIIPYLAGDEILLNIINNLF